MEREARRYYPNRELAAHVLGFANVDGDGIEGLELALDDRLRGSVRAVPAIRDRRGARGLLEQLLDDRASQGDDVELTIDKTIQTIAERELELGVRTFEARAGSVVVMDPDDAARSSRWRTTRRSTRTSRGAAESARPPQPRRHRSLRARLDDEGVHDRGRARRRRDPSPSSSSTARAARCEVARVHHPRLAPRSSSSRRREILAYSSNIGAPRSASTLGRAGLFRALRRFGFGESTGLPLPGETSGILRHYRRWYEMDAATISFGQGMSATNVQLADAMSAIANGGRADAARCWCVA